MLYSPSIFEFFMEELYCRFKISYLLGDVIVHVSLIYFDDFLMTTCLRISISFIRLLVFFQCALSGMDLPTRSMENSCFTSTSGTSKLTNSKIIRGDLDTKIDIPIIDCQSTDVGHVDFLH
jgi:hypothetical protein